MSMQISLKLLVGVVDRSLSCVEECATGVETVWTYPP